jgi:hypothetical protein
MLGATGGSQGAYVFDTQSISDEGSHQEESNLDNAEIMGSSMEDEDEEISVQDFADNILVDLLGNELEFCLAVMTKNELEVSRKTPMSGDWDTEYDDDLELMSGRHVKRDEADFDP